MRWENLNHDLKIELIKSIAIEASEIAFGKGWDSNEENQKSLQNIENLINKYLGE